MVIDHIGIVVKNIEEGIRGWAALFGYRQATEVVRNELQRLNVVFLEKEGSLPVKLIEPLDEASSVWVFSRRGGGLHHLCFKVGKLGEELARLEAQGARVLVPPQPGEAFGNEDIAFIYAGNGLNVELIETSLKAARLDPQADPA